MHTIDTLVAGPIDGTINCQCGFTKYEHYPNAGWGRKSVGIRRMPGQTKKQYVTDKLVASYVLHIARAKQLAAKGF